jgi:hypothetical protein
MKISNMISELSLLWGDLGDVEVLISDGLKFNFYRGNYNINKRHEESGEVFVDIGIGGCDLEGEE